MTGSPGKAADDERVADGPEVARRRGNARGATGPLLFGNASDNMEGRGDLTMASIRLQDLRRRLYVKAKADKDWRFWASTSMYASWRRYARPIR
jgi:hypothetical protein